MSAKRLDLFPISADVNRYGHLMLGGCDSAALVRKYGSPLYIFDEATMRSQCREYLHEFKTRYKDTAVAYASKAFINKAVAQIIKEEGMGLDTVSGGEITVAQAVGFDPVKVFFHGNNKSEKELNMALDWGLGRIVVDNLYELELLNSLAAGRKIKANILLRLNPSVDPHTHKHTTTGILDSKFGLPIGTGQAEEAVKRAMLLKNIALHGLHFHLGSPISETGPYKQGLEVVLKFAADMKSKHSFSMKEFSPGGGFAVRYISSAEIPPVSSYAEAIVSNLIALTSKLGLPKPRLIIEPGRSIIARSGVAIYTVGSIKDIPSVRTYVCVDGGMGDNIRPALYEAKYEALLANKVNAGNTRKITIAGRYCESGDLLIKDIAMPEVTAGDLVAIPVCGAYCVPMSSNYNMVPHPPIVMVSAGKSKIIRRGQKYSDLMKYDVLGKS